jgi:methylenetetrahydrofolate dehydrogenase (NADP+)/methenyltetrahydrofolate cyclohydrolase
MSARIIDGKAVAARIRAELEGEIAGLEEKHAVTPGLAVILVGENPASQVYVRSKNAACRRIGIRSEQHTLDAGTSEAELSALVRRLNDDPRIHGILVQLPLPAHIDARRVLNGIRPDKDVDGFHPVNLGKLMLGEPGFRPCTPLGIQQLLAHAEIDTAGAHVVVVGRSDIVGKPIAAMLLAKGRHADATVTVCHSKSRDLAAFTRQADILIAACGQPEMITAAMVAPSAVVIDVGINRLTDPESETGTRLVGDVKFDEVAAKCAAITPVPGGVGPMTIAMLLRNTVQAARQALGAAGGA